MLGSSFFAIIIITNVYMKSLIKLILVNFILFYFFQHISFSQDKEFGEILENIQKDLKNFRESSLFSIIF